MSTKTYEIKDWLNHSFPCECGEYHTIPLKHVCIEEQATMKLADYCQHAGYSNLLLVADQRTYLSAGGSSFVDMLEAEGLTASLCLLQDNEQGEVVADEETIVQVLLALPEQVHTIVAVGSGTIHDLVRFVSSKTNRPFISVPTAPSVDGYSSVGAPLLIQG